MMQNKHLRFINQIRQQWIVFYAKQTTERLWWCSYLKKHLCKSAAGILSKRFDFIKFASVLLTSRIMFGVTVCSVLYLVLLFLAFLNFHTASGQKVHNNAFKHIQQETTKVAAVLQSLNLSAVRILENVKHYEDGLVGSVGEFVDSNVTCSKALERLFLRLFEGKIEAIQSKYSYINSWVLDLDKF